MVEQDVVVVVDAHGALEFIIQVELVNLDFTKGPDFNFIIFASSEDGFARLEDVDGEDLTFVINAVVVGLIPELVQLIGSVDVEVALSADKHEQVLVRVELRHDVCLYFYGTNLLRHVLVVYSHHLQIGLRAQRNQEVFLSFFIIH